MGALPTLVLEKKNATHRSRPREAKRTHPMIALSNKILYLMEIALSNSYQLLIVMKRGTSPNLSSFYFHSSWIYVEIMTQNVNLPI